MAIVSVAEPQSYTRRRRATMFLRLTSASGAPLQLIRGDHEPFNRLAVNESIHNLRDIRDRDASVKKVIGFD